jgi:DNA-binding GntR family transcriptional regulator
LKWHNIITEHQAIVDAVKAKDAELASHLVADHLLAIDDDVKAVLSAYPNYFEGKAAPSHQPD